MIDLSGHVIVLDMDDTLYHEADYARSGFAAVGRWMMAQHGIDGFANACIELFDAGVRGNVFDQALDTLGPVHKHIAISEMVAIYRAHRPKIALEQDAARLLRRLHNRPSALITDGPLDCQCNKVDALGLRGRIGKIILTAELPSGCGKPHAMPFEMVEEWSGQAPQSHVYIADNPAKDFLAPKRRGWLTVQIDRPERIHVDVAPTAAHAAVHAIESLDEISLR